MYTVYGDSEVGMIVKRLWVKENTQFRIFEYLNERCIDIRLGEFIFLIEFFSLIKTKKSLSNVGQCEGKI